MADNLLFLLQLPVLVISLIEEDAVPTMLQRCYQKNPLSTQNHHIQSNCLDSYLNQLFRNQSYNGLERSALDWLDSLGRKVHNQLLSNSSSKLRIRKEIRTLSEEEREDFFDAINALKSDKSVGPNKYDAFALMHQGLAIPSAHEGYNFVGWHRYYLVLFETALREKRPGVTLAYFDSSLDFRMQDPVQSIIWTELFMGNGKGVVYTGPFAYWITPTDNALLHRDIPGPDSSLIDPQKLRNVFKNRYHRELLSPTAANSDENLESHHDGVHRWIGGRTGQMNDLMLAPQDPVFWLHHSYVDYLWERFRERQRRLGIDSAKDYPETTDPFHQPNREMDYLYPPITNIEGYSNSFTRKIYSYEPTPSCKNKCGGSDRVFLYCNEAKGGCVSRTRSEFLNLNGFSKINYWYPGEIGKQSVQKLLNTKYQLFFQPLQSYSSSIRNVAPPTLYRPFKEGVVDPRTKFRKRRSVTSPVPDNIKRVSQNTNLMHKQYCQNGRILDYAPTYSNTWAVAPLLIHYERNNKITPLVPTYGTDPNQNFNLYCDPNKLVPTETFNITVQTDGISYNSRYTDNVVIDMRSFSSELTALIAFRKPTTDLEAKALVTVYDSYGTVCQPTCLVLGRKPTKYRKCSGVIKITSNLPLMYLDYSYISSGTSVTPYLKFMCRH